MADILKDGRFENGYRVRTELERRKRYLRLDVSAGIAWKMKRKLETTDAPGAIGPYSQGITVGNFVYTSGQLPIDPKNGEMPEDITAQTRKSLENCRAVLQAAGATMQHVVKTTVFLKNMADFAKMNEEYTKYFEDPYPARMCVAVAALPKDALVEIECVAYKEDMDA